MSAYQRVYKLPNVSNSSSTDEWNTWFTVSTPPPLSKIEARWSWRDQGWGNQKGRIRAVLVRGGSEVASQEVGGIAPHELTEENFVGNSGDVIANSQPGDELRFQYIVGGGGGHELFIENFTASVFPRVAEFGLPDVSNSDSTDNWIDWFTTDKLAGVAKLEANWTWHDQGWGNQKGRIRAVLVRDGQDVATLQIGGIAPHESTAESFVATTGELFDLARSGDVVKFQYIVGGGGGHALNIQNFRVKLYVLSFVEFQLPSVSNSDSTDNWNNWFETGGLPAVAKLTANWTWKDQGWGNQKGTIRAVSQREGQDVATQQIGGIAPHESTAENAAISGGDLVAQSQNGDNLKFQYLVGGGGGHELFINDFTVQVFAF